MFSSPDQEPSHSSASTYSNDTASLYPPPHMGENALPTDDRESLSTYSTPEPQAEQAAYQPPPQRRGMLLDLLAYPGQSVRSFCQPGMRTFAQESWNARWSVIWISLFALPVISSAIALVLGIPSHHITSGMLGVILLGPLVVIPILFFIIQGMIWPLARHYQGTGTFLEQCYTTFLPLAPLFLLSSVIAVQIATNAASRVTAILILFTFALFIYSAILLVISLKAVHGVTGWEAFTLAILPLFSILAVLIVVLIIAVMIAGSSNSDSSNSGSSNNNNSQKSDSNDDDSDSDSDDDQNRYYGTTYWWGGQRYANSSTSTNQGQGSQPKIQWQCPVCSYRRWVKQGPAEVACARCDAPMQMTEATR